MLPPLSTLPLPSAPPGRLVPVDPDFDEGQQERTQVHSWTHAQKPLSAAGCRLGPRGGRRRPDPTAEARCRRSPRAPLGSPAACDADVSPTRLRIAAPRSLRRPALSAPAVLAYLRSPLRCARTACRPPPALCKAKVDALLGRDATRGGHGARPPPPPAPAGAVRASTTRPSSAPAAAPSPPGPRGASRPGRPPGHPLPRGRSPRLARGDRSRPGPEGTALPVPCRVRARRTEPHRRREGRARPPRTPRPRGPGSRKRAARSPRVPGLRRRCPPRGPWPRAHSGLARAGCGSGTAAPCALGSGLCHGAPELRTPVWKGQARAERRSQGGAGRGAAPPPRPGPPGLRGAERLAPPGPRWVCAPHLDRDCALVPTARGRGTRRSLVRSCLLLGRSPWRFELGKDRTPGGVGGDQRPEVAAAQRPAHPPFLPGPARLPFLPDAPSHTPGTPRGAPDSRGPLLGVEEGPASSQRYFKFVCLRCHLSSYEEPCSGTQDPSSICR
ncbi:collagen alpha-1(I) chain-like [Artibeus jamaicensis]|uniref:collagen alpha-1(I) chain-like n=1 Tax=Artibeus jamaicensis TaxID=9417 RepID=UPI00235AAF89|nr:collagen alpha-1(I) chain-like [Artibeus jamaicensis]